MKKIRYLGKRPRMVNGRYMHNDEIRKMDEREFASLAGDPDFEVVGQTQTPVEPVEASASESEDPELVDTVNESSEEIEDPESVEPVEANASDLDEEQDETEGDE